MSFPERDAPGQGDEGAGLRGVLSAPNWAGSRALTAVLLGLAPAAAFASSRASNKVISQCTDIGEFSSGAPSFAYNPQTGALEFSPAINDISRPAGLPCDKVQGRKYDIQLQIENNSANGFLADSAKFTFNGSRAVSWTRTVAEKTPGLDNTCLPGTGTSPTTGIERFRRILQTVTLPSKVKGSPGHYLISSRIVDIQPASLSCTFNTGSTGSPTLESPIFREGTLPQHARRPHPVKHGG